MVAGTEWNEAPASSFVAAFIMVSSVVCLPQALHAQDASSAVRSVAFAPPRMADLKYEPTTLVSAERASKAERADAVKGGAIAGAIVGAVFGVLFVAINDDATGTRIGVALGSVAVGAGAGALVGFLVGSLE